MTDLSARHELLRQKSAADVAVDLVCFARSSRSGRCDRDTRSAASPLDTARCNLDVCKLPTCIGSRHLGDEPTGPNGYRNEGFGAIGLQFPNRSGQFLQVISD